jgi:cyclic pyranopterin phosphate synthase
VSLRKLSHIDARGRAKMVDVSEKPATRRQAEAEAVVVMREETLKLISSGTASKGDVLSAARIAGILAAKKTAELIPLCHSLLLGTVDIRFSHRRAGSGRSSLRVVASVRSEGQTGVEMEAMTAVSTAALTIYDMCKAADRWMTIGTVRLLSKEGGKSGRLRRPGRRAVRFREL